MTPPLEQRSFGEVGGGVVAKERSEAWWGGGGVGAGKSMCGLDTSSLGKNSQGRYT
jgi:hypothetical protein